MARLYLAYGSNLSRTQMLERCPGAENVAPVMIHGWRLVFVGEKTIRWGVGGVAGIVEDGSAVTPAALYVLPAEDELRLDGYEGLRRGDDDGGHYTKSEEMARYIRRLDGSSWDPSDTVFTYICTNVDGNMPSLKYLATIRQGYSDWRLPGHPLEVAGLAPAEPG